MIRALIATTALATTLVACGADSRSSTASTNGSTGSSATVGSSADNAGSTPAATSDHATTVIDYAIAQAATAGFTYDRVCVTGVVAKLSDADLELLYESTLTSTSPHLSDGGQALGDDLFACSQVGDANQTLVDQVVAKIEADGSASGLDPACVQTRLATLSDEQLQALLDSGPETTDPKARGAAFVLLDCLRLPDATATATS